MDDYANPLPTVIPMPHEYTFYQLGVKVEYCVKYAKKMNRKVEMNHNDTIVEVHPESYPPDIVQLWWYKRQFENK